MPQVSVIIPVYNAEAYLRSCLNSVLGQTLHDLEVICVDDGSVDTSTEILAEYAAKDSRVKVITQANTGSGAARNVALAVARGDFVAFLDADDLYPDAKVLEDLVAVAARKDVDVCGGSLEELLPNGAVRSNFSGPEKALSFDKEGIVNFRDYAYDYGYYRFIYRRTLLVNRGIRFPEYRRFQDPPFMVRALASAGTFYAIPRVSYRYRVEVHVVDWHAKEMRGARDLLLGLADTAMEAKRLNLRRLSSLVVFQACEQYTDVLMDKRIMAGCANEVARLCEVFGVQNLHCLFNLDYPGKTLLLYRKLKCWLKRNYNPFFRHCRFISDVYRYGLSYAKGRFMGSTR